MCMSIAFIQQDRSRVKGAGTYAQDQRIPIVVFHQLHAAAVESGPEIPASKLQVKKWISVLVSSITTHIRECACFNVDDAAVEHICNRSSEACF